MPSQEVLKDYLQGQEGEAGARDAGMPPALWASRGGEEEEPLRRRQKAASCTLGLLWAVQPGLSTHCAVRAVQKFGCREELL